MNRGGRGGCTNVTGLNEGCHHRRLKVWVLFSRSVLISDLLGTVFVHIQGQKDSLGCPVMA